MAILEVCVDNIESVKATVDGGGTRVELCSSLLDGGLTPSVGFLQLVKREFPKLVVFAMIRPRGGDFFYNEHEMEIMKNDIESLKKAGADGFVFGCLSADGSIDLKANNILLKCASPLPCTFHRAFDMTKDATESLQNIIALGFSRILTSGHSKNALEGIDEIHRLIELAGERIIIMPGSGITLSNVETIITKSNAREYHSSCSQARESSMQYKNLKITMGQQQANCSEYCWKVTSKDIVHKMIKTVGKLSSKSIL